MDFELGRGGLIRVPPRIELPGSRNRGIGIAPDVGDKEKPHIRQTARSQPSGIAECARIGMDHKVPRIPSIIHGQLSVAEWHVMRTQSRKIGWPSMDLPNVHFHSLRDDSQISIFGCLSGSIDLIQDGRRDNRHERRHDRQHADDFDEGEAGGTA